VSGDGQKGQGPEQVHRGFFCTFVRVYMVDVMLAGLYRDNVR
jgi:hypothetical protein